MVNIAFALVVVAAGMAAGDSAASPARKAQRPSFDAVSAAVERGCAARKDAQPGEIISHGDWDAVVRELAAIGWTPSDAAEINKLLLADQAFLVAELRTKAGRKFMADIHRLPGAYDRLDRLSAMAQGASTVRRLIAGPDGYKLLEYMTTTSGGRALGQQLSTSPGGRDFNAPTGRIYTTSQLIARLKISYDRQAR